MVTRDLPISIEQFENFINHPDNADKTFELIMGEIIEVPSNPYVSRIGIRIARRIDEFVDDNDLGHVTGEAGRYVVGGDRYAPDVAFISYEKQSELARQGYNPNPPDLAVEVVSNENANENRTLTIKVGNYLAVGTVVWVVRPEDETIEVYESGKAVMIYHKDDTLQGSTVLPNFEMKLKYIFKKRKTNEQ